MTIIKWYSLITITLTSMTLAGDPEVIFENNFNHHPESKVYEKTEWQTDWDKPKWENGVEEGRVKIVKEGEGAYLSVSYPAYKIKSKESGAQWKLEFGKGYEAATLTYKIKFHKDFNFVRGGKLPGLVGGNPPTGSKAADGKNGWSARYMWRDNGAAIAYTQHVYSGRKYNGKEEDRDYWYHNGQRFIFKRDQWYTIEQKIELNTPNQKDGILEIRVDGQLVKQRKDIMFRRTDKLQIDQLYFSTFYGGSESSWQPLKDETIYFDDFKITGETKTKD